MRKFLTLLFSLIFVGGLLLAIAQPSQDKGGNTKNNGGVVTWDRKDEYCLGMGGKQKTFCHAGGSEQCTAKYCN